MKYFVTFNPGQSHDIDGIKFDQHSVARVDGGMQKVAEIFGHAYFTAYESEEDIDMSYFPRGVIPVPDFKVPVLEITRRCKFNDQEYTMKISVSRQKLARWDRTPLSIRRKIQDEFPELEAPEREFLLSGTPPEVWDQITKDRGTEL